MNEEIKRRWVEALRSGKYQQGRGQLRHTSSSGPDSYCCLGVLCDLYDPEGWETKHREWGVNQYCGGSWSDLPPEVQDWAEAPNAVFTVGLDPRDKELPVSFKCALRKVLDGKEVSLAVLNDHGASFEDIAWLLENRL